MKIEWTKCADELPTKYSCVLVDGDDYPTYMVAIYDPGGLDGKNFPWAVYYGYDCERFSLDAFHSWSKL